MATFYNQATLSYNGQTVNSNITEGELAEAVTASKTAVVPTYGAAGDTAFVISIVNGGEAAYTDLTVTDNLGEYTFGGSTLTPLTYTENSVKLIVNGELQAAPADGAAVLKRKSSQLFPFAAPHAARQLRPKPLNARQLKLKAGGQRLVVFSQLFRPIIKNVGHRLEHFRITLIKIVKGVQKLRDVGRQRHLDNVAS